MNKLSGLVAITSAAVLAAACSDMTTNPVSSSLASAALVSAPIGFDQINTSFVGSPIGSSGFDVDDDGGFGDGFGDGEHHQHRGGPGWDNLMGGGIADAFAGRIGFGHEGRGPFGNLRAPSSCAFSSSDNRLTCPTITNRGLTINRSFAYLDASGAVQQVFDTATTNSVNVQTSVTGTTVHHHNDTSTVNSSSNFTVAGLASGSTQRTVNGTTSGTESTTGKDSAGVAFTAVRVAGDTVSGVVIPIQDGRPTFPTAGTVVRSMQATVTLSGQAPSTSTRREVITFNGTNTATIEVTQDGVTKTGTVSLHEGGLTCH